MTTASETRNSDAWAEASPLPASPVVRLLDGYASADRSVRRATALGGRVPRPLKWWTAKTALRRRALKMTARLIDAVDSGSGTATAALPESDQLAIARFRRKLERGRGYRLTATRAASQTVSIGLNAVAVAAPSVALAIEKTPGIKVGLSAAVSIGVLFLFGQGEAFARRLIGMPGEEPLLRAWRKDFATKGVYTLELMVLRTVGLRPRRVVPVDLILKGFADLYLALVGIALEQNGSKGVGWALVALAGLVLIKLVFVALRRSLLRRRLWRDVTAAVRPVA